MGVRVEGSRGGGGQRVGGKGVMGSKEWSGSRGGGHRGGGLGMVGIKGWWDLVAVGSRGERVLLV